MLNYGIDDQVSRVFWDAVLSILSPACSDVEFARFRRDFSTAALTPESEFSPVADSVILPTQVKREQTFVLSSGGKVLSGFSKMVTSMFTGVEDGEELGTMIPDALRLKGSFSVKDCKTQTAALRRMSEVVHTL